MPMDQFAQHLLPSLLSLSSDSVANVRVLVAKALRQSVMEKGGLLWSFLLAARLYTPVVSVVFISCDCVWIVSRSLLQGAGLPLLRRAGRDGDGAADGQGPRRALLRHPGPQQGPDGHGPFNLAAPAPLLTPFCLPVCLPVCLTEAQSAFNCRHQHLTTRLHHLRNCPAPTTPSRDLYRLQRIYRPESCMLS